MSLVALSPSSAFASHQKDMSASPCSDETTNNRETSCDEEANATTLEPVTTPEQQQKDDAGEDSEASKAADELSRLQMGSPNSSSPNDESLQQKTISPEKTTDEQKVLGEIEGSLPQLDANNKKTMNEEDTLGTSPVDQQDNTSIASSQKQNSGADPQKRQSSSDDSDRTSNLIKKQLSEIEREITRRIQNNNVRKVDESEIEQLLIDHGFGKFVDAESSALDTAALPFRPQPSEMQQIKPSLEQLRSSFSPPQGQHPLSNQFNFLPAEQQYQQQGMPPFISSMPTQQHQMPFPYYDPQQILQSGGSNSAALAMLQQGYGGMPSPAHSVHQTPSHQPFVAGGFYQPPSLHNHHLFMQQSQQQQITQQPFLGNTFQHFLPQQSSTEFHTSSSTSNGTSPPPVFASALPPTLSAITPEIASALLQQIQQQNPSLIKSFVEQHQQQKSQSSSSLTSSQSCNKISSTIPPPNSSSSTPTSRNPLPALPHPPANVYRKAPLNNKSSNDNQQCRRSSFNGSFNIVSSTETDDGNCGEGVPHTGQLPRGNEPIWVMRESYLRRLQRDEQRQMEINKRHQKEGLEEQSRVFEENEDTETDKLLQKENSADALHEFGNGSISNNDENEATHFQQNGGHDELGSRNSSRAAGKAKKANTKKEVLVHEPAVLIEGVLFRARYLGSTQLPMDSRQSKMSRMSQAQEAVARVKAPEGESQPSTEIDLFISTEKIMVLNTDLQRISETDVRQDILIDNSLRSISYIADIGDLVVLMARRMPSHFDVQSEITEEKEETKRMPRIICHVFESDEASFIAQSIGQAFQVAYIEFLRANGIDDPNYLREIDYQEVLNSQELMGEELELFARKETQKDVIVPKKIGEALGVVVVESGWGSMLPTAVIANMAPGGPASRSNQLNIGDQIIGINGISLVGLPLTAAQQNIKNARSSTAVRLTVVSTPPVVEVRIKRPDTKYQLGFSVQNGVICSLLRGGIAERGGIRVGHRIIEINHQSVVAVPHEKIVNMLATATGEIHMKTMPTSMFRLLTGQEVPNYI